MISDSTPILKNPKIWQISEVEISYRNHCCMRDAPRVSASVDAEKIFRENWSADIELLEEFVVMLLNKANQVKALFRVSRGGVDGTVVDVRIVFAVALKAIASGIILAHNHPSGNLCPSQADIDLTKKFRSAGAVLDLKILDHIILAPHGGFYSFADEGEI